MAAAGASSRLAQPEHSVSQHGRVWRGHGSAYRGASHGKKRPFATAHRHESGGGLMPNRGTAGVGRWALGVGRRNGYSRADLSSNRTGREKASPHSNGTVGNSRKSTGDLIGRPDLVTHSQPPIRTTGPPRPRPPASKDELRPTQCLYEMCRHKKHGRFLR
ncbi:hypothetical protein CDEST_08850 [Colletotrichum destructivum]|uniref:Uncharacterized protein n=1 Tax=Colletotrichum destructivum TaxID=34406 RepID=A0AAX4IL27_9PEZI|nr:hypothetical protein CDEST_08850 [Colletotrichum destructivum]